MVGRPHLLFRANHYCEIYATALFEAENPDAKYTTKSAIYQTAIASINASGCKVDIVELQADLAAQMWLKDFDGFLDLNIAANQQD